MGGFIWFCFITGAALHIYLHAKAANTGDCLFSVIYLGLFLLPLFIYNCFQQMMQVPALLPPCTANTNHMCIHKHMRTKVKPAAKCFLRARWLAQTSGAAKQQKDGSLDADHHPPASPERCRGRHLRQLVGFLVRMHSQAKSPGTRKNRCWVSSAQCGVAQGSQMPPVPHPGYLGSATIAPAGAGRILKSDWSDFKIQVLDGIMQLQCCWSCGKPTLTSLLPGKTLVCTELLPHYPLDSWARGAPAQLISGTPPGLTAASSQQGRSQPHLPPSEVFFGEGR